MAEGTRKDEARRDGQPTPFRKFEDFVRKMAAVPKEELNEKLAEEKRDKKEEKRAG